MDGATVFNAGDVPVLVSRIVLQGGLLSQRANYVAPEIPIDQVLQPGAVKKVASPASGAIPANSYWVRGESEDKLHSRIVEATGTLIGKGEPCNHIVVFGLNDSKYRMLLAGAGATLNSVEAKIFVEYEPLSSPEQRVYMWVPATAAVLATVGGSCPTP